MLTTSEKIRTALIKSGVSIGELAERLGQSRQNLSNKLSRDNFTVAEMEKIAAALNITYESCFVYSDGTRI